MNAPFSQDPSPFTRGLRHATTWAPLATLFAWGALATMYIQGVQSRVPADARVYADNGRSHVLPAMLAMARR